MHETRFASDIVGYLKKELSKYPQAKSILVVVSLSPFSHVTPDGLQNAFRLSIESAGIRNAELQVKPMSLKMKCKDCGYAFESQKLTFHCGKCLSTNVDFKRDREFAVDSIEIEDA